jgi:16S rRNA (adenine1518-N6/adenine1519-N6)-dimethyltransferase
VKFRHNTDIGQNFLVDNSVVTWMTARSHLGTGDRVLEIGPGDGALTKGILASGCSRLDAVEIDTRLAEYLEPIAASVPRLVLHWGDAVRFNYETLGETPTRIIANLPYHITTPILWKLLEAYSRRVGYMLLMTQAEAASRLSCGGGVRESNPLSITIAAMGNSSIVRKVSRTAFRPSPKVDSAIVEIVFGGGGKPRELPRDDKWRRLLSGSFATRRKTLSNNWSASFGIPKEESAGVLSSHSLGGMSRPEELSVGDWLALRGDVYLSENL